MFISKPEPESSVWKSGNRESQEHLRCFRASYMWTCPHTQGLTGEEKGMGWGNTNRVLPSALIDGSRAGAQIAGGSDGKASACNAGDPGSIPQSGRFPWRRKWQLTPVFLPGKFHGWRSLVRLQSLGSQRVGHDWRTSLSLYVQEGTWLSKAVSWVTQNSGWDGSRLSRKTEDDERAASPLPVCPWRLKQAHGLRWLLEAKAPQSIMEVTYPVSACSHLLLG